MTGQSRASLQMLLGLALFCILFEVIGQLKLAGSAWPPLSEVISYVAVPRHLGTLTRGLGTTATTVALSYGIGVAVALLFAALAHLVPVFRQGLDRLAAFFNAIPPVAIVPIFIILTSSFVAGVSISALYVFFIVYVAATAGLDRIPQAQADLFQVSGATTWRKFVFLDMPVSLPLVMNGLRQAIPAAIVGTVLAEWFSGEGGLGLLIISAMRNMQMTLLWSAILVIALCSIALFSLMSWAERESHKRFAGTGTLVSVPAAQPGFLRRYWAIIAVFVLWAAYVELSGLNVIVLPGPVAVIRDILGHPVDYLWPILATVCVTTLGLSLGMLAGTVLAIGCWLSSILRGIITPLGLMLASVPVVAIIPIIARISGPGVPTLVAVTVVITFFPAFVYTSSGLASTPPGTQDVFCVSGASRLSRLTRLAIPSALPNWAVGLRVSAPSAMLAAMTAEYLIGDQGLGYVLRVSTAYFETERVLGATLISVTIAISAMTATQALSRHVLDRWT